MIRMLFIGRGAPEWAKRIGATTAGKVETDAEKLPAAGIRRIDESPPDVIVVVAPQSDARLGILLEGIRSRPVGGLAPLLLVSSTEPPEDVRDLYDRRIADDIPDASLLETVRELLELELAELMPAASPVHTEPPPATTWKTAPMTVQSDFPPSASVDDAAVDRKLREVRHENYFVILEVAVDSAPHSIRDAFQTQSQRFAARNISSDVTRRREEELREIRDAIEDAWAVLGNDRLREGYARHHR